VRLRETFGLPAIDADWASRFVAALRSQIEDLRFDANGELVGVAFTREKQANLRLLNGQHLAPLSEYQVRSRDDATGREVVSLLTVHEWSDTTIRIRTIDGSTTNDLTLRPDNRYGLRDLRLETRTGSKSSFDIDAVVDADNLFEGKGDTLAMKMQHRFGVGHVELRNDTSGSTWTLALDVKGHGRGLLRPLAAIPMAIMSRRIAKTFAESVAEASSDVSRQIRLAVRQSPESQARRVLEEWLFDTDDR
jgi:hypothetical protein